MAEKPKVKPKTKSKPNKSKSIAGKGDNPRNWLFEKKSLRIKTRKKEMFERRRYFEYWPFNLQLFIPSSIANRMDILASKPFLWIVRFATIADNAEPREAAMALTLPPPGVGVPLDIESTSSLNVYLLKSILLLLILYSKILSLI